MTRLLITMEYPPDVGGVAEYYAGLVGELPEGSVTVMTPRTHRFFSRWIWPHWLPLLWNARRVIRRERPDEVWVGQILPIGTALWILKKLRLTAYCLPLTIFCHGMDVLVPQRSRVKTWLVQRILATAHRVVVNSRFTMREVKKLGVGEERIRVVHPCPQITYQESGIMNNELRDSFHLHGKKILLTVARLVRRKGIDLVIEAVAKIKEQFPDLAYVIVGDGPEREALKTQCQMSNVKCLFVGSISDAERATWYDCCDVFIMTPRQIGGDVEGFGLVYLEANLFGKPVIGSRSGGVPEAVVDGETGILVPENDPAAIADAIVKLMADSVLANKMGEQGRARVKKEFQWGQQVLRMKE
ncbi:glycosyltransferase family 4 protein [Candidatus Uhrbacteria bacterium]|nr:glycosyltransferase family 4 protein [Candidatus Uhrbacteria bacterium]